MMGWKTNKDKYASPQFDYPPQHYESRDNAGQWSTSSSPVSRSRSKNRKATSCMNRRRLIIVISLGLTFASIVACGITIPLLLMKGDKSSDEPISFTEYEVSLRIDNIEYTEGMGSGDTDDFKRIASDFCGGINNLFVSSSSEKNYEGCVVNELRNGSVIVDFLLVVNDVTTTEADIMATLSQNVTDNDSVVMNGFWYKPSSITLGSVTISATSQLSTGNKANTYFFSNSVSVPVANEMSFVNNCSYMHSSIPLGSIAVSASSQLSTVSCGPIPSIQNGIVEASGTNYGDVLNISCNEGYTVNGSIQLTCKTANYWGLTSSCQINQCEAPNIPAHVTALNQSDMTYSYGSNLTLSCNEGYTLETDPVIHCQANGSWTTLPECRLLSCPSITMPENSLSNDSVQTNYTEGLSVKITCEEGYEMVLLKTCSLEIGWIDTFECESVTCDQFTASSENHIENVTETGLSYGSYMTIRCEEGYEIDGKRETEVTCLSNKKWSQSPDCRPINCGQINIPKHAVDISTYNSSLHDKVNISCEEGYDLQGDAEVTCQSNGAWTSLSACVPVSCGDVADVANGDIILTSGSNFNDYAVFNCDEGYMMTGNMSSICQANGTWSPQPTCEPVSCEEMTVENGSVNGTSVKFGETIQVTCDNGFRVNGNSIITCQSTKTWSENPRCDKVVCIDNLTLPDNSYLSCKEETIEFGGYLEVQCMFGYKTKDGDNKINCLGNGSWSKVPECSPIICPNFTFPNNSKTPDIEDKIYVYNDTVMIECLENHELTGSETVSCLGDGSWSKRPTCEPITCPKVDPPENAIFQPNMPGVALVGEQLMVECENGFMVTGDASFTCLSNGTWSRIANCLPIQCSLLQLPNNSRLVRGSLNESIFNDTVTIDCDTGYEIQGNATVTCLSDESWSMLPACTKKVCPNYNLTDNAYIEQDNIGTPPKFGENLVLNCLTGYILMGNATTVCLEDQKWSSYPTCEIVKCPENIQIDNGRTEVLLEEDREYGDVAQFICDEGFERTNDSTIECKSNGTWKVDGSCEIADCGEYNNTVQNRIVKNETGTTYGSRIYFECNANYIVIGPNPIYCQANKTWQDGPTCLLSACGPTNGVENGFIRSINDTTFEVVCELGYYVNGTNLFSCESWNNLITIPSCQPVDCGFPSQISNGRITISTGTTFGYITRFECEPGYEMSGNSNVSCLATGVWDNLPSCDHIDCGIPPQLVYGRYVGNVLNTTFNSTLTAECVPGYIVRDSLSTTTCLQTGQWSDDLECVPIECPTLVIDNGRIVSVTDENRFGSVASVVCNAGFTREKYFGSPGCNESGLWENSESCALIDCGTPESPANGKLEPYTMTTYNTRVYLSCDSGFMLHGDNYSACELDGTWSRNFSCDTIDCGDINTTFDGNFIKATTTFNSLAIASCSNGDAIPLICGDTGNWLLYPTNAPFTKDVCNVTDEVNCGLPVALENGKYKRNIENVTGTGLSYGNNMTIRCEEGYEIDGKREAKIVCLSNKEWSPFPDCRPINCGLITFPKHAIDINTYNSSLYDKVNISCEEGYDIQGDFEVTCQSNGTWTALPICVPVSCGDVADVANGALIVTSGSNFNDYAVFNCDEGYEMMGNMSTICQANGTWSPDPSCVPVVCEQMTVENGSVNGTSAKFGDTIQVSCDTGFRLNGNNTITCQATKTWSETPRCEKIVCVDILALSDNSYLPCREKTSEFGGYLELQCMFGYEIKDGDNKINCLGNGSWSKVPECSPIICPNFTLPNNSKTSDLEGKIYVYNDTVVIQCLENHTLNGSGIVSCLGDGSWSVRPTCELITCPKVDTPENAIFQPNMPEEAVVGEKLTVECENGFMATGNSSFTCLPNGTWSKIADCLPIQCTMLQIPKNSFVVSGSLNESIFNDEVTIDCNAGYEIQGNLTVTCLSDESWSMLPACTKKVCPNYNLTDNAYIEQNNTGTPPKFGENFVLNCLTGYNLMGNATTVCLENQEWSSYPTCEIVKCPENIQIDNGRVEVLLEKDREYGDIAQTFCDEGFERTDNLTIECTSNGTWKVDGSCEIVDCGEYNNTVQNGIVKNETGTTYGSRIYFECNANYIVIGPNPIYCQANKTWQDGPTCLLSACGSTNGVENGFIRNINDTTFEVFCALGYYVNGTNIFSCESWNNLITTPSCQPVDCGFPSPISNGRITRSTGTTFGYITSFECEPGYEMSGNSNVSCFATGLWGDLPSCDQIDCGIPPQLVYGRYVGNDLNTTLNSTLTAECLPGYIDNIVRDSLSTTTCLQTGQWSDDLECVPIECPTLVIDNGRIVSLTDENRFGSVASIVCNAGFTRERYFGSPRCNESGLWENSESCALIDCGTPEIPANGKLEPYTLTTYNTTVNLSCDPGFVLHGDNYSVCELDGQWSGYFSCDAIDCGDINTTFDGNFIKATTTFNSLAVASCSNGDAIPLICGDTGNWLLYPTNVPFTKDVCNVTDEVNCGLPVALENDKYERNIENVTGTGLSYGNNMTIRCEEGYEIDGKREAEIVCLSSKEWSPFPDCRPINCGLITFPKHAIGINTYNSSLYDKVNISCEEGYDIHGDFEVTCQSNGTWTALPICVPVSCEDVADVANGALIVTSGSNFNDYAVFNCDEGYEMMGNMSTICQANGTWSPDPSCVPVVCEEMTVENGSVNGTSAKFGDTIQVTCDTGFRLNGNNTITCQATKTWSETPRCEKVVCVDILALSDNSYLPCREKTSEFGGYLELQCTFGYEIKDGDNKINCLENGSWSKVPECFPIICPNFTLPNNSKTSDLEDKIYVYNDTVVIQCLENHTLNGSGIVSCLGDGSWSVRPTCELITCPKVDTPENAIFQPNMPEEAVVGEKLTVECENGFMATGNASFTCLPNGTWSRIADCLPIQCTMLQLPKNSFVVSGSLNKSFFNDEVTIDCNAGYEIQGNVTVTCLSDESWSMLPSCTKKACPNYNLTDNVYIEQNNTGTPPKFGENLVLNCLTGYILIGNATTVCLENQEWSSYQTCEIVKCPETVEIDNGRVEVLLEKDREYGDITQAFCNEGFEKSDNLTIECTSNGTWKVDGSCEIVDCGEYNTTVQNGIVKNETGTTYGSRIYFECNANYIVIGPNPIYCQANKTWQDGPTCLLSACGPTNGVENGFIRNITDTTFEVFCKLGYYVNGTNLFSCESWNNLITIPSCQAVDCGFPSPISNGRITRSTGTTFGYITSFECEPGYEMSGNSNVSCHATGVWDNLPSCDQIDCGIPPQLVYGRYVGNDLNTTFNSTLTAECLPGYIVRDSESTTTCLQTGQWSDDLECVPIECPTLVVDNGQIVSVTDENRFGSVASVVCNAGFTREKYFGSPRCNESGLWENSESCALIDCGTPESPANGKLEPYTMTTYNTRVYLSCDSGFMLHGDNYSACELDGTWSRNFSCDTIDCGDINTTFDGNFIKATTTFNSLAIASCSNGDAIPLICGDTGNWLLYPTNAPFTKDVCNVTDEVNCGLPVALENGKYKRNIENVTGTGLSYGNNMTIRCEEGYEIDGKREAKIVCLSNKEWSPFPDCRPINCGLITFPKHAIYINTYNSSLYDKVNISCEEGYDIQGDFEVTCQSNGTWTALPICVPVSCGDVADVANGALIVTSGSNFNDYAVFNCDEGYEMMGNMSTICQANGTWSPDPSCVPVVCEQMTVENGSVNGTSATFGDTIQVSCDTGFRLNGNNTITCQATKTWSETPRCEKIVCVDILALSDNSYLPCREKTSEFGGYLELQCMFGYEIKDGDNKINCLGNGSWSKVPECSPIICPNFTLPNNSKTSDLEGKIYVYNDTVVIQCLENHTLNGSGIVSCLGDGSWSVRPTCELITCPKVDTPENAIFQPNMPEEAVVGEKLTVECENGFMATGNSSFTCLPNGTWSKIADCLPIQCTMLQIPKNSFVVSGSLNESIFNDEVTIDCNAGYEIQGNLTVTCLSDESWSMLPACTKKVCPNYNLTDNAYIEQNNTGTPPKFGENFVLNCLTGYNLMGNATTVCLENQEWSSYPTCEIVKCPENIQIDNGRVEVLLEKDREYGDIAQTFCDEGFERTDNLTIECTSNGTWKVDGSCEIVDCGEYNNTVQNGIVKNETGTTYGSRIYFECNANYIVIGPNPIYCQANKTWQDGPTCLLSACGPTNGVENGFIRNINDTTFEVFCALGYYVNGTNLFSYESWNNSITIPSCQAVDCGFPSPISNGRITRSTGTTFGYITSFECEPGYEMSGNSNVSCLATGLWGDLPSCDQIDCGIPPQLVYGRYVGNELNTTLNSTLTAECAPGYIVRDSVSTTTCLQTGQWSDDIECLPIECPTLAIDNGQVVSLTDENRFGSVASVACNDGFTRETCFRLTRCNESGIWENSENCNPVDCGTPEIPANVKLEPYTLTTYNTTVYLSCDPGFMLHGDNYSACELDGQWSGNFSCDTIDCGDINVTFDGNFIKATTTFNSLAIASCNNGDAIPLICGDTGNWLLYPTNVPFTKDVCNVTDEVNCGLPVAVENGKFVFISGIKTLDYATAECNIGYEMAGNETIICERSGNWSTYPTCSIVDCGNPYPPANARNFSDGPTTYGSKFEIECIEGFVRQTNNSVVCESDGYWTSVSGCVIDCGEYEMVQNGTAKFQNGTGLQSVVIVECDPGFHLFNQSMDMVLCTQYGKWKGDPYCIDTDPGESYMRCLQKDIPAAIGENVTIDCLLRDVNTIDRLTVVFNGDEIYSQTYANTPDNNIVIGNGDGVTINLDSDKMVVGFQVNCQTEGTYVFKVNDDIEDTVDVRVISKPTIEDFGTPQDVYLNQKTVFTCIADLGRTSFEDSLADIVFEKILDDGVVTSFSNEEVVLTENDGTCLNVVTATLILYPDTSYNNTLIRCTLANSTQILLTTDTYQVAILESDLFFIERSTSKTVLIGDDLILHCNMEHVLNFEMMTLSKGQDILSTLHKNSTVVPDTNSIGILTSYDGYLKLTISSAECSAKGAYICTVFTTDGEDISTIMEVKMARLPVHPDFFLTIDVIENKIPWLSYPTLCSGSLGYPMGVMYLETNVNGDFTVLNDATFLYSNNDEECTASGNLTYFNTDTFNMSWDGTEMRCVVENVAIYEYTYMLYVSRTVEIIPVSICQGRTPNQHFEHPYACHSAITCENGVPLPNRYKCLDDECYNWNTRLCTPCENLNKCIVPTQSVPTAPPPTQTLDCPRQVHVSKDETVNISCLVTNDVILLTNLTTWYLHIQHDGSTMLDTRDDLPTTDNEEEKVYTLTDGYVVEVSDGMVQLTTTIDVCNKSGVYIIEYVKNFTLQSQMEIVVTAPVQEPQMSMSPAQFYRNQLITVTCSGHVGNPPSALSLVSTADVQDLTTEITVDQALDENTCGYIETVAHEFYVRDYMENATLMCETALVNGTSIVSNQEEIAVFEPFIMFDATHSTSLIGSPYNMACRWDININFDKATIRRRSFTASQFEDILIYNTSEITEALPVTSSSIHNSTTRTTITLSIGVIDCEYDGEYICDLELNGTLLGRTQMFLYITETPGTSSLTLPIQLVTNTPTLQMQDYLECVADVGYRNTYDVRFEYYDTSTNEYETFNLGSELSLINQTSNCRTTLTMRRQAITFDESWEGVSLRCAVFDTLTGDVVASSETQTVRLLDDHCDGLNDETFGCHPYNCSMYTRCHSSGYLSVLSCQPGQCVVIRNRPVNAAECRYDCTDVVGTPCCP